MAEYQSPPSPPPNEGLSGRMRAGLNFLAGRGLAAIRPAESLRESELVMVLYRTALILSLGFSPWIASLTVPGEIERFPPQVYFSVAGAFLYNSLLFFAYHRNFWRAFRRPLSVGVDLVLISLWISFGHGGAATQFIPLYYFEVLAAAMWFGLVGSLMAATTAICLFLVLVVPFGEPALRLPYLLLTHLVPYIYLVALLTGLLAQAESLGRERLEDQRRVLAQFRHEMDVAQRIHQQAMPAAIPQIHGFELGVAWRVAETTAGVYGGDVYGVRRLEAKEPQEDGGRYEIFVGDVAGKTFMAVINLPVLTRTLEACLDPDSCERTMRESNALLYHFLKPTSFASLFYAHLDVGTRMLTYVNAGNVPPALARATDGDTVLLEPTGPALGALARAEFKEESLLLEPGDALVIYTDGVTSARNSRGEEFGEEGVAELLAHSRDLTAQHIADRFVDAVSDFEGRGRRPDDLTILVLKAEGLP